MKIIYGGLLAASLITLALTHIATFQAVTLVGGWLQTLLLINIILIVVMLILVTAAGWRLWRAWRRDTAGAKLSARLAGLFLLVALVPASALYLVSAGGVFRGIESWFDTPLDRAFEKGADFGRHVLRQEFARLEEVARGIASDIDSGRRPLPFWLDDLRLLYQLDDVIVTDATGRPLSGELAGGGSGLSAAAITALRERGTHHTLSGFGTQRNIEVSVLMPYQRAGYALRVSRALPEGISEGLHDIESGRQEYEKLLLLRRGLLFSFMATLTLSFMTVLAVALWASLRLGTRLVRPLVEMAEAALAVGRGNFKQRLPIAAGPDNEMTQLSRAFNAMVDDLDQSRQQVSERQVALAEANTYLENLLSSLSAGVLATDSQGRLTHINQSAKQILNAPMESWMGQTYHHWEIIPDIAAMFKEASEGEEGDIERRLPQKDGRMLLARARLLPANAGGGVLVVVDDISRQLQAERDATWEEASQRFAHEIKNPLTPIQLAAERLQRKLGGKLTATDEQLLARLSTTIINQVSAMREMVDEFRLYADDKRRRAETVNLNALLEDVTQLYERPNLRLDLRLAADLPPVAGDTVLLRQVLHNLLGNAAEAVAQSPLPWISVETVVDNGRAIVKIADNGGGVQPEMLEQAFEPYVTSKKSGTGLGLAVVRKVMEELGGSASLKNIKGGACAELRFGASPPADYKKQPSN